MDEITPDCQAGRPCLVPPLIDEAQRILEIRGLLMSLRGLIDPGTVCRLTDADLDDLKLLAVAESIINEMAPNEAPEDG